jgi:hypothetical protein
MQTPAWLTQHDGALKLASDRELWIVHISAKPQYTLRTVPVQGKYGCAIKQINNGQTIESSGAYPSAQEAIQGGLEDLRRALGW